MLSAAYNEESDDDDDGQPLFGKVVDVADSDDSDADSDLDRTADVDTTADISCGPLVVLSDDEEVEEEEQETDHSMKTSSTVTSVGRSGVAAVAGSHNDDVVNLLDSPPPPRRNMSAGAAHRPADAVPVFKRARSLEEDDDHDSQQRRLSAAGLVFTSFSLLSAASISSKDKVHMKARDTLQQHFQPICAKAGLNYAECKVYRKQPTDAKDMSIDGATLILGADHRRTVSALGIQNGTHFVILEHRKQQADAGAPSKEKVTAGIKITIMTEDDRQGIDVPCVEVDTIASVIAKYKELAKLSDDTEVVLEFEGDELEPEKTLEFYDIEDEFNLDAQVG